MRDLQAYYQALSLRKLGQADQAAERLQAVIASAGGALKAAPPAAGESQTQVQLRAERARLAAAHNAAGLGHLGLDNKSKGMEELRKALAASPDHAGARFALDGLD
jgi:hypothetical protein